MKAAKFFGFGLGYAVCEIVALLAVSRLVHPLAAQLLVHTLNITFLIIVCVVLVRNLFSRWRKKKGAGRAGAEGFGAERD